MSVIEPKEVEIMLGEKISYTLADEIIKKNIKYDQITNVERDLCIMQCIEEILKDNLTQAGVSRKENWEKGWSENLKDYVLELNKETLVPKYYGKLKYIKLGAGEDGKNRWVKLKDKKQEHLLYEILVDWVCDKYLLDNSRIQYVYEFGCGPGNNLVRISEKCKNLKIVGLDWSVASQNIIEKLSEKKEYKNISGKNFDYFNPDYSYKLKGEKAVVLSVASMEQIGDKYKEFVDFLIKNKVECCINIEPIIEMLDENNLIDFLSIKYMKKRNYLQGYLTYLEKLERKAVVSIYKKQRTGLGSTFGESSMIIVWGIRKN